MAGELQPLDQQFAIVDSQGRPTLYFIKWAQQRQIDIGEAITLKDLLDSEHIWTAKQTITLPTEQFRLGYNISTYVSFTVNASKVLSLGTTFADAPTLYNLTYSGAPGYGVSGLRLNNDYNGGAVVLQTLHGANKLYLTDDAGTPTPLVLGSRENPADGSTFTAAFGAWTISAGKLNTAASVAGNAGLGLPHGVAPTSPADGDVWTTTAGIFVRINGATVGPLSSGGGGGGGITALGAPDTLSAIQSVAVNFYLMKSILVSSAFTINKIAFEMGAAIPAAKMQPFVYASSATGVPGALLATGPQVTGAVSGYNEVPLAAPLVVTKGAIIYVGVNVTTAALTSLWCQAGGIAAFAANGGSTVPANPCPAVTSSTTANQIHGFWAV